MTNTQYMYCKSSTCCMLGILPKIILTSSWHKNGSLLYWDNSTLRPACISCLDAIQWCQIRNTRFDFTTVAIFIKWVTFEIETDQWQTFMKNIIHIIYVEYFHHHTEKFSTIYWRWKTASKKITDLTKCFYKNMSPTPKLSKILEQQNPISTKYWTYIFNEWNYCEIYIFKNCNRECKH